MENSDESDAESFDYSLEISDENLEDLLAYDDLFLDFFNAFLALPVFPQALVYNRLTGAFEEIDESSSNLTGSSPALIPSSLQYGATDTERDKMLEWARKERLPVFLRTQLFRELKLVKLLLRPLEDRQSASRQSSRDLRGYSRQTETYVSSLSNSIDISAPDALDDYECLWGDVNYSALYRYQRPGSRALSVPIRCIQDDLSSSYDEEDNSYYPKTKSAYAKMKEKEMTSAGAGKSTGKHTTADKRAARISSRVEVIPSTSKGGKSQSSQRTKGPPASSTEEAFKRGARALSAPVSYVQFLKMPPLDFDTMFGEEEPEPTDHNYVTFEGDHISDEQTETDVRNMEGRFKMPLQQIKELVLSSHHGFQQFRQFLWDTSGHVLLNFWLDCENFKDTMEDFDGNKQREMASLLFRDVQDKYKLKLTQDAKEQIARSASNMELSHTIFLRTQYDVLRRLRAYWLPRYLIHCQYTNSSHFQEEVKRCEPLNEASDWKSLEAGYRPHTALFPTIWLSHSLPLLPEDARNFTFPKTQGHEILGGMMRAASCQSLCSMHTAKHSPPKQPKGTMSSSSARYIKDIKERFLLALSQDKLAGSPFQHYLSVRPGNEQLFASLLFWQDVSEYEAMKDSSADRLLRLYHAWTIYNKYLAQDSPYKVEITEKERLNLHQTLQSARDYIDASIFHRAKTQMVRTLEKVWIRYLKEDLKAFLDCRVRVGGESPPSTADAIEITVTDQHVLIKRPRPWVRRISRASGGRREQAKDEDDELRAEKRKEALEKRKTMERERRKAIRAAYARQKEASQKKRGNTSVKKDKTEEGDEAEDNYERTLGREKELTYHDVRSNKQVMSMFRKYLTEQESGREVQNQLLLFQEIEGFFAAKDSKHKKDAMAAHIFKLYLEPEGKKHTEINGKIAQKLSSEKERPKSAILREIQHLIQPKVEETFKEFVAHQSEEMNVNPEDLAHMSRAELSLRMGTDQFSGWQKPGNKGRGKGDSLSPGSALLSQEGRLFSGRAQDTPSVPPPSYRRGKRGKQQTTGRSQPSREDKNEFLQALGQSAAGQPTDAMLYFYKYLLKHGEESNLPLLDKDLFFYIEVQKFKDCSHAHSDDELLKRKVQCIVDCFLDSVYSPSLQIDISNELQQKTMKAAQRYLSGKEILSSLFDEAQFCVFKDLLPYWAGFRKTQHASEAPRKRPVTKYEKLLKKRLENIENYQIPSNDFHLPRIPEGAIPAYTISLAEGVTLRESSDSDEPDSPLPEAKNRQGSKLTIVSNLEKLQLQARKGPKMSLSKESLGLR